MTVTIQIGKSGVSQGLLDHVKKACRTNDTIELNFLQSYTASENVETGVNKVKAYLEPLYEVEASIRGHTATLTVSER